MDVLDQFLANSTIHGLSYIQRSNPTCSRLVWTLVVATGFCLAGLLISSSISDWDTYPVTSSISTHPIAKVGFPKVTVCPPKGSSTALTFDIVKAQGIPFTDDDREESRGKRGWQNGLSK